MKTTIDSSSTFFWGGGGRGWTGHTKYSADEVVLILVFFLVPVVVLVLVLVLSSGIAAPLRSGANKKHTQTQETHNMS